MLSVQNLFTQLQAAAKVDDEDDEEQLHFQFLQLNAALDQITTKQT